MSPSLVGIVVSGLATFGIPTAVALTMRTDRSERRAEDAAQREPGPDHSSHHLKPVSAIGSADE